MSKGPKGPHGPHGTATLETTSTDPHFALAADLVRTAVAPTWDDISKLAVIATIRTMLNYFLAKDIASFDKATGVKSRAK